MPFLNDQDPLIEVKVFLPVFPLCMDICIYVSVCMDECVYVCGYMYTCMCVRMYVYVCIYMYAQVKLNMSPKKNSCPHKCYFLR